MKSCAPKRFAVKIFHELLNCKERGSRENKREREEEEEERREKKRGSCLRSYGITWDNNYFCKCILHEVSKIQNKKIEINYFCDRN